MPIRVLLLGLLFTLSGIQSAIDMGTDFSKGMGQLNLAVLLVPVGLGLLLGKTWALWWAKASIVLASIILLFALIGGLIHPSGAAVRIFGTLHSGPEAIPYLWYSAIGYLLALFVAWRLFQSPITEAYFVSKNPQLAHAPFDRA